MKEKYEKIIRLPHKQSETRKHMSLHDRAAQFAPFAALTGYEASIKEQARLTSRRLDLDEYEIERLDRKLHFIAAHLDDIKVAITYFVPDALKSGGRYVTKTGNVIKIDEYQKNVVMDDRTVIAMEEIINIEEVF